MTNLLRKGTSKLNAALGRLTGYALARATKPVPTSRSFVNDSIRNNARLLKGEVLELGSAPSAWLKKEFGAVCRITTLDQTPHADNVDIVGNIETLTHHVPPQSFDVIVCTEVMEHVSRPFDAANEIYKALKPGGTLLASAPFLYEIHGEDYGDYWRITRQGWKVLLRDFKQVEITWIGSELAPKHYFVVATK